MTKMKLLILGGTMFLGRHLVDAALQRGHEVTIFHRGTQPFVSPAVETITGDRHGELAELRGRRWDVVIDTSGYLPRTVRAAAEVLSDTVDRYVFISSQSVGRNGRFNSSTLAIDLENQSLKAGIDAERERLLLRKWHETGLT